MFLPGFPAPSAEVVGALWAGERPTPFDALAEGLDLWEGRFGVNLGVRGYVGAERLGVAPEVSGEIRGGLEAGGADEVAVVPGWQRVLVVSEDLPELWRRCRECVLSAEGNKAIWDAAMFQSLRLADQIRQAFASIGRHDMDVLLRRLGFLRAPLCRWAWVVGLLEHLGRPLLPSVVIEVMTLEALGQDAAEVLDALLVVRLMQGQRSMASYVLGRWLVEEVWGMHGLSGPIPMPMSALMQELSWIWVQRDRVRDAGGFLREEQRVAIEALRVGSERPSGIASGMAVLWGRLEEMSFGGDRRSKEASEIFSKPWVSDSDPWGEIKDGDAYGWSDVMQFWGKRRREVCDRGGRLERVLLPVVDAELSTQAALLVLRWRHHIVTTRVWREPERFTAEVQHWLASVLARMDGGCPDLLGRVSTVIDNHWFDPGRDCGYVPSLAALRPEQERDWRVTEFLRPLVFAALASMAIGLKVGNAVQLQELAWVREKVWDPRGPLIRVDQAFAQLLMLCGQEKCSITQLRALPVRLGRQLGVSAEEVEMWLSAQPFELLDLEAFRQLVLQKKVEALSVGGLVETLNARAHFKPVWLTGPLTGLAKPRPHGDL